jgi:hypothetical protein
MEPRAPHPLGLRAGQGGGSRLAGKGCLPARPCVSVACPARCGCSCWRAAGRFGVARCPADRARAGARRVCWPRLLACRRWVDRAAPGRAAGVRRVPGWAPDTLARAGGLPTMPANVRQYDANP